MTISSFQGDHSFLSNFWPCVVALDSVEYPSVEHAYVAAKTLDPQVRLKARTCRTPGDVKRLGRKISLRTDWNEIKLSVMSELLDQKFGRHPDLRKRLLATGDRQLIEGNTWGDTFWGVCNGVGENHLGKLLMKTREKFKSPPYIHPVEKSAANCWRSPGG